MNYRCRRCGHEESRGCIPSASCGLLLVLPFAGALALQLGLIPTVFPDGLRWWWLLAIPLLVVISVICAVLFNAVIGLVEWLIYCRRQCPQCRSCSWSRGFTRGFGT